MAHQYICGFIKSHLLEAYAGAFQLAEMFRDFSGNILGMSPSQAAIARRAFMLHLTVADWTVADIHQDDGAEGQSLRKTARDMRRLIELEYVEHVTRIRYRLTETYFSNLCPYLRRKILPKMKEIVELLESEDQS